MSGVVALEGVGQEVEESEAGSELEGVGGEGRGEPDVYTAGCEEEQGRVHDKAGRHRLRIQHMAHGVQTW